MLVYYKRLTEMSEDLIETFFHMQMTIKLYHWQTTSFARHKATDDLLLALAPLIDQFVEVYMGRYKRPNIKSGMNINIEQLSDKDMTELVGVYIDYLKNELPKNLKSNDTDLLNIRDEMLGLFNKTAYLFTLS